MATWASKTPEEQAQVQAVLTPARALVGQFTQLLADANLIAAQWGNGASVIMGTVDNTELIPNASGLADAQSMTRANVVTMMNDITTISATAAGSSGSYFTDVKRALYVSAAGINAVV
jgi:hypothetical protein